MNRQDVMERKSAPQWEDDFTEINEWLDKYWSAIISEEHATANGIRICADQVDHVRDVLENKIRDALKRKTRDLSDLEKQLIYLHKKQGEMEREMLLQRPIK